MKELTVTAIKEGTVIDHIPSSATFKVAALLKLENCTNVVTVAANLQSKNMGKKGLIKIGDKVITKNEADAIAILAPKATVNIIKEYKVIKKIYLSIPKKLENIIKCSNPECITNNSQMDTLFWVIDDGPLIVRCNYCERIMNDNEIIIKS